MKRILVLVTVALVMAAMIVAMSTPAFAVTRPECVHNVLSQLLADRGYFIAHVCAGV